MKTINYKGRGEHSVNELELIIEQQAEELHLIKSGQKPLIIDSVRLSCFKEVFKKFQEIEHESEFYGWLHAKAHEA